MEEVKVAIGKRLKELRLNNQISQEKLANIADIDRTYVTSVENGKRNISIINIKKLCDALGISMSDFFNSELFEEVE